MMVYQKSNSSEEILKMDMEYEKKTTFTKGRPCDRKTGIFVLGTLCIIIMMILTSAIFFHQQRTFSVLESWIHRSNQTSVKPGLQITERQQDLSHTEVKSLMNNLSSSVSALTSKLNDAVGNQEQKQTETLKILDNVKSAVTSLQSDLQNKQRDFESLSSSMSDLKSSVSDLTSSVASLSSQIPVTKQDESLTEVKSLMNSLSSAVSALAAQLNDAVKKQDQKQTETERSLDSLNSSIQTDQQNKQRDFETLRSSLSDLKSSVSDLSSSVASLSSKQQTSEERVMNALKDLKSNTRDKTTDVPVTCKSGWKSYKSSCFLFSSDKLNWTEARDYCKAQDALLLKIQDDDMEWKFLNNHTIPIGYWVGLTDQTTGQWRWADDTPYTMNTERWNPGQPDDWTKHGLGEEGEEGEDCGQINFSGKLNDNHCSVKMRFICRVQN